MKIYALCVENSVALFTQNEFSDYIDMIRSDLLESGMYEKEEMDHFESTEDPLTILNAAFGEDEYDITFRTFATN